jgi:hypothetical protein
MKQTHTCAHNARHRNEPAPTLNDVRVTARASKSSVTEDPYVSLEQIYEQIRTLTSVRLLTARNFTRKEQVQNHVHLGNFGFSLNVILNWLDSMTTAG